MCALKTGSKVSRSTAVCRKNKFKIHKNRWTVHTHSNTPATDHGEITYGPLAADKLLRIFHEQRNMSSEYFLHSAMAELSQHHQCHFKEWELESVCSIGELIAKGVFFVIPLQFIDG